MRVEFTGEVWYWRGPSPFHFVTVPDEESAALETTTTAVSYGWGMLPVTARIGGTRWTTALWPKDGGYILGLKDLVRRKENLDVGDVVDVRLDVDI